MTLTHPSHSSATPGYDAHERHGGEGCTKITQAIQDTEDRQFDALRQINEAHATPETKPGSHADAVEDRTCAVGTPSLEDSCGQLRIMWKL